jgi:prepilin-type N-terminal cleavage/methylation domain-containing protein
MKANNKCGFTLIELLIVVAIIAILAAIAVPNFLEAQTRSKVSRCKADMRSVATALEAYRVDNTHYPMDANYWGPFGPFSGFSGAGQLSQTAVNQMTVLFPLTSPISYLGRIPLNVFPNDFDPAVRGTPAGLNYVYQAESWLKVVAGNHPQWPVRGVWSLSSVGPDKIQSLGEYLVFGEEVLHTDPDLGHPNPIFGVFVGGLYDPTNGTISAGDIVRIGP